MTEMQSETFNSAVMEITPGRATRWLEANTRNRNLNARTVAEYARDMRAGAWVENGEAIKLSRTGVLLDGQHRLAAIIESGTTLPMLVVVGLPDEAQNTMDLGRKRTVADQLGMAGETNSVPLAAIARRVTQWEQGNHRFTTHPNPTAAEVRATLERFPHLRRSAELGARVSRSFKPVKAAVVGVSHHLFTGIDQDQAAEFFARLETGADLPKGHPILVLRERFTQDKLSQRHMAFHQSVAACIRSWNALRLGEEMVIIKVPADLKMPRPI